MRGLNLARDQHISDLLVKCFRSAVVIQFQSCITSNAESKLIVGYSWDNNLNSALYKYTPYNRINVHILKLDSVMPFSPPKCTVCISSRKKDLKDFFSDASSALNRSSRREQREDLRILLDALIATMRSSFAPRGTSGREGDTNYEYSSKDSNIQVNMRSVNSLRSVNCVGMCVCRKPIADHKSIRIRRLLRVLPPASPHRCLSNARTD